MSSNEKGHEEILRAQIAEIRAKLKEFLSSNERAVFVVKLHELNGQLAALTSNLKDQNPCRYGIAEFADDGKIIVKLSKTPTVADFLHVFGHSLVRTLPPEAISNCKGHLNVGGTDGMAFEEAFACAFERFFWDEDEKTEPSRQSIRNAMQKVYPTPLGTRIESRVPSELKNLFRLWSRQVPNADSMNAAPIQNLSVESAQEATPIPDSIQRNLDIKSQPKWVSVPWQLLAACTIAALVGLLKLPYGYYTILRSVICIAGAYGFSVAFDHRSSGWMWIYAVIAVFYNPVFPIRLGSKDLWIFLNVIAIAVLWFPFWRSRRLQKRTRLSTAST